LSWGEIWDFGVWSVIEALVSGCGFLWGSVVVELWSVFVGLASDVSVGVLVCGSAGS
jgi:hypothetical protein